MYPNFPRTVALIGDFICSIALAIPKSRSFTSPLRLNMTFDGETSRCTMPRGRPS